MTKLESAVSASIMLEQDRIEASAVSRSIVITELKETCAKKLTGPKMNPTVH